MTNKDEFVDALSLSQEKIQIRETAIEFAKQIYDPIISTVKFDEAYGNFVLILHEFPELRSYSNFSTALLWIHFHTDAGPIGTGITDDTFLSYYVLTCRRMDGSVISFNEMFNKTKAYLEAKKANPIDTYISTAKFCEVLRASRRQFMEDTRSEE